MLQQPLAARPPERLLVQQGLRQCCKALLETDACADGSTGMQLYCVLHVLRLAPAAPLLQRKPEVKEPYML